MYQDVTTRYLGIDLRSPIVVGSCPLTLRPETVRELAIAGAGAVVLPSLMQEQLTRWTDRHRVSDRVIPEVPRTELQEHEDAYNGGVESYLRTIPLLKRQCGIPIIASLNGCNDGPWLSVAKDLEAVGADAIEISVNPGACDPTFTAEQVERPLLDAVKRVRDTVSVPVAVKLLPFYTTLPNLAWKLTELGADAMVLFGREPVWEILNGDLVPTSHWQLSSPGLLQTTLSGLIRVRSAGPKLTIAASGGISTAVDVIHAVTAGADVAMVTSEIYRTGPDAVAHLVEGLCAYLKRNGFASFAALIADRRQRVIPRNRNTQVEPMLAPPEDKHTPRVSQQQGDRWGHPTTPSK